MDNIIIGTAGHIDHGKTTLIKALTGRETDTLEEEKERGISINLGFTYFDLPNGQRAGIIDVPGHEKFIKNMMAGCVGMDIILLVVASDDGVMPQTIEHAQIIHYMGVENVIIVLTKCDIVDAETINLVKEDVRLSFKDTILSQAPLVEVDSVSGRGLEDLKKEIVRMASKIKREVDTRETRMNLDRSFTLSGVGTVVTGTLIEGMIKKDSQYMLYPAETTLKVKNIQSHGVDEDVAHKGQRVALNLANISSDSIERGDIIASPKSLLKSSILQCRVDLSTFTSFELKHWERVRFFAGTKETIARAVPLSAPCLKSGQKGLVEFRLEEEVYYKINDKFVIRTYSPLRTIGGGRIIDGGEEKHTLSDTSYIESLLAKKDYTDTQFLSDYLRTFKTFEEIYRYTGLKKEVLEEKLDDLTKADEIVVLDDLYIEVKGLKNFVKTCLTLIQAYHQDHPLERGMGREEFKQKIPYDLSAKEFKALLENKYFRDKLTSDEKYVSDRNFKVNLENQEGEIKKVLEKIKAEEPRLLKYSDLTGDKKSKDIISYLQKESLLKLENFVILNDYLEKLKKETLAYLEEKGEITVAEFRDLSGMSRKQALEVLEYFDKKNLTSRKDDVRVLKK